MRYDPPQSRTKNNQKLNKKIHRRGCQTLPPTGLELSNSEPPDYRFTTNGPPPLPLSYIPLPWCTGTLQTPHFIPHPTHTNTHQSPNSPSLYLSPPTLILTTLLTIVTLITTPQPLPVHSAYRPPPLPPHCTPSVPSIHQYINVCTQPPPFRPHTFISHRFTPRPTPDHSPKSFPPSRPQLTPPTLYPLHFVPSAVHYFFSNRLSTATRAHRTFCTHPSPCARHPQGKGGVLFWGSYAVFFGYPGRFPTFRTLSTRPTRLTHTVPVTSTKPPCTTSPLPHISHHRILPRRNTPRQRPRWP